MNKLILYAFIFLFASVSLYAQSDSCNKNLQRADKINELQDFKIKTLEVELKQTKELLVVRDIEMKNLRKDSASNSAKLKELDSSLLIYKVRKEKLDSIEKELVRVNNKLAALEKTKESMERDYSSYKAGIDKINKVIADRYLGSFELLVKNSSLESVETDLLILESLKADSKLADKMNKLRIFKQAEILLGEKLNESKIEAAKNSLVGYNKEKPFSDLFSLLSDYKVKTDALKTMVNDIQRKNSEKSNVEALKIEKKEKTMYLIENYILLYSLDLKRYSYLNQIVVELKSRKLQNVDADVLDYLDRL